MDQQQMENDTEVKPNGTSRRRPARKAQNSERVPVREVVPGQAQEFAPARPRAKFGIRETFGIDLGFEEDGDKKDANGQPILLKDANGNHIIKERDVNGFAEPTQWTPKIDTGYVFSPEETKVILLGMELKDRILLVGETGTGKSTLLQQIAARLNYNVVRINFDGGISRQDLVGEWVIKGEDMQFQYGILCHAFRMPGTLVLLDEWDTISGDCSFVLQRPLEKDDGNILVMETGGELIPLHPDNVIAATANTKGQGDETGNYQQGTKVQNYAQLNRFGITIELKYMSQEEEVELLKKKIVDENGKQKLSDLECITLVKAVNHVREAYTNGELSAPLSPRDLLNWADKFIRMGDPLRAARYCFLNRMPEEDAMAATELIQRSFKDAA